MYMPENSIFGDTASRIIAHIRCFSSRSSRFASSHPGISAEQISAALNTEIAVSRACPSPIAWKGAISSGYSSFVKFSGRRYTVRLP